MIVLASGPVDPDCLVFDVDGVLIESRESYQETIRKIVEREWDMSGFTVDRRGYSPELNRVLKNHGAFNDDYDIAWTLLNIAAAGGREKLSEALPQPETLAHLIADCGNDCVDWLPRRCENRYDRLRIRQLGRAFYAGADDSPGEWTLDKPMLDIHWSLLPLPPYIYTGRDEKEWRLAQKTLQWDDFPDDRVVQVDMGIKKPSPEGLEYISRVFGHERPIFFGDTMSDFMSSEAFGRGWFAAVGDMIPKASLRFPDIQTALSQTLDWKPQTT
ncbi:MAG: HAD family hydrolase [Synergistaceae bacterium]|jgi:phosphoglycolate phosphatase-like HAD superfamily hydrolase|nr:HAD family hydrolase [Synergistaceae bacterium]